MSIVKCPHCQRLISAHSYRCSHCQNIIDNGPKEQYATRHNRGANPYNSLAWTIIAFLFCPLCGVISLIYYFKSEMAWNHDDEMTAARYGKTAINWSKVPLYIMIAVVIIGLFISLFAQWK